MRLNRQGRENYELQITTTTSDGTPITADQWEASFDHGLTYVGAAVLTLTDPWTDTAGVTHPAGDLSTWLLAGPDVAQGTAVAVIPAPVRPLLRVIDNPEIIVRTAPRVVLY